MKIQLSRMITVSILLLLSSGAFAHGKKGSVGAGVGASYGMVGGSFDLKLVQNLYASAGLGLAGDTASYNFGLRYYLVDADKVWRPRLVANYGTNGVISRQVCYWSACTENQYETFEGTSFGLGQSVGFGGAHRHGFEADILYIADDGGKQDRIDELELDGYEVDGGSGEIYFSLGYRFSF